MKPFNLQEALAGATVVTRSGKTVTQFAQFSLVQDEYSLYGVVEARIHRWLRSGKYAVDVENHSLDLFMDEPEHWVNVYWVTTNNKNWCVGPFPSEEIAKQNSLHHPHYQATIKLKDSAKEN